MEHRTTRSNNQVTHVHVFKLCRYTSLT